LAHLLRHPVDPPENPIVFQVLVPEKQLEDECNGDEGVATSAGLCRIW
jgi:hypothetical protein